MLVILDFSPPVWVRRDRICTVASCQPFYQPIGLMPRDLDASARTRYRPAATNFPRQAMINSGTVNQMPTFFMDWPL